MSTQPIVKNRKFNSRQVKRIFYRRLGIVIWVSFLIAAIETSVFYAFVDPQDLVLLSDFHFEIGRMQGYAFGFIFFWLFTFIASYLCGILMALPRDILAKRTIKE